jgi:hypothetical protein
MEEKLRPLKYFSLETLSLEIYRMPKPYKDILVKLRKQEVGNTIEMVINKKLFIKVLKGTGIIKQEMK